MAIIRNALVIIALVTALYQDIIYKKISNYLVLVVLITGLSLSAIKGIPSIIDSLYGIMTPFFICFVFYSLKMLGAGDIKLYCALGAVMGKDWILNCMALSVLAGGILALLIMIYNRSFLSRMRYLFDYFKGLVILQRIAPYQDTIHNKEAAFPFAVAIMIGGVLCFWVKLI